MRLFMKEEKGDLVTEVRTGKVQYSDILGAAL